MESQRIHFAQESCYDPVEYRPYVNEQSNIILILLLLRVTSLHLISLYNIIPESHIKVMRIKEMITNKEALRALNHFTNTSPTNSPFYSYVLGCQAFEQE